MVAVCAANVLAGDLREFKSPAAAPTLVELFTSEGCSSCPPAEKWFSTFKSDARLWKEIIPVNFHVDYWDDLGWKDPQASHSFTLRQRHYSDEWRKEAVYTPGFAVNGIEWRGWFDHQALPVSSPKTSGLLTATAVPDNSWTVRFDPPDTTAKGYVINAALLGFGISNQIKAGENRGRTLDHDFVVLKFISAPAKKSGASYEAKLSLPQTSSSPAPKQLAAAFWVCSTQSMRPIQAAGGWLAP